MAKRLYRSESDRILGGVCGGIAEVYDLDPTLVRLVAVALFFGLGTGLLAYLVAWLIIPTESEVEN
ncbi:PspC domain-containing protein [Candidatus Nanosalina sp. VS9-1]|uniref:PspC domain-containing protein n=1 Tax=Candidatus Nanosalina sp. VS9-1 TaxID=3388566 RepID=UPI0039E12540